MFKSFSRFVAILVTMVVVVALVVSCTQAPTTPTTAPTTPATTPTTPKPTTPGATTPVTTPTTQATTPAALKQGVIKVGMTTAMSGTAAAWGIPLDQAQQIVFDQFNKEGGIVIGDTRYTIKTTTYDDAYTMDKVVANARKLIYDDKVDFLSLLGGTSLQAAMPLVMENKIITFGYSYVEPEVDLTPPHSQRYAFWVCNPPADPAQIHQWVAKNHPEAKKLAILGRDDAVGKWAGKESTKAATAAGIQVVATEFFNPSATDMTPQLRKIMASNPDYMDFVASNPGQIGLIVKQARELGYKGAFYDASVGDLAASAAIAGETNFIGFVQAGAAPSEPIPPEWVDFVSRYVAKYGLPFNTSTINRANGPMALVAALKGAKTLDPEKLMSWLETNHFQTLTGDTYFWGAKQYGVKHLITAPMPIVEYIGGGKTKLVGWTKPQLEE